MGLRLVLEEPDNGGYQTPCDDCEHFHVKDFFAECPPKDTPCGDYRCCINY